MSSTSIGIRFSALAQIFGLMLVFNCLIFLTQDHFDFDSLFVTPQNKTSHSADRLGSIETIELAEALQFFNNPEAIFLDVRDKKFYDYGHIERARYFPIDGMSNFSETELKKLKEAPAVVIYCNGTPCGSVYVAAQKLSEKGLDNVKIYAEGWPEWRLCQLPITMSEHMKLDVQKEHL
jgi:rhodanese-related sulfurtransferase